MLLPARVCVCELVLLPHLPRRLFQVHLLHFLPSVRLALTAINTPFGVQERERERELSLPLQSWQPLMLIKWRQGHAHT